MVNTRTRHYGAAAVVMAIFTIIALILLFGILLVLAATVMFQIALQTLPNPPGF